VAEVGVDIVTAVRDAGVVGAGGAGFPTHVKLANEVDTYIANGAECEPILEADKHSMLKSARDIVRGLELAMEQVGAVRGVVAIKGKNADAVEAMERAVADKPHLRVQRLGNTYPAGDEFVLVREITGRTIPPGGLPFMVGATVNNVVTLKNIARAAEGESVTSRVVTVAGEVAEPVTVEVPVGTKIADLIEFAGGATVDEFEIVVGGPIMGSIADAGDCVTKTVGGVIVLPTDHTVVRLKREPVRVTKHRAKMCCTCQECTMMCPRNALGHPISPARMMSRSWHIDEIIGRIERGELDEFTETMVFESLLCCQCGVCELYACIFGLSPNKVYALVRDAVARAGLKFDFSRMSLSDGRMFEYRKLPAPTLVRKLGLEKYVVPTEYKPPGSLVPNEVLIPLRQHIGAPAVPVVKAGDEVRAGDVVGEIPDGKLGARVHASIDGRVTDVTEDHVSIRK